MIQQNFSPTSPHASASGAVTPSRRVRLLIGLVTLALVAASCGGGDDGPPARSGAALEPGVNIVQTASGDSTFSTLVTAVTTADLVGTLSGADEFTVFAPTNAAFDASLAELGITADELLADKAQLTAILRAHVVPGLVLADQLVAQNGGVIVALDGTRHPIVVSGSDVSVGGATVITADIHASNGIIHAIDRVLEPLAGDPA